MICFSTGTHTYGMIDSYVQKVKVKASMASYIHITMWLLLWSYFLSMVHPVANYSHWIVVGLTSPIVD